MWQNVEDTVRIAAGRALDNLAGLLPSLIALALIMLFSVALAWLIRLGLRRTLRSVKFDARLEQWGFRAVAELSPGRSPRACCAG